VGSSTGSDRYVGTRRPRPDGREKVTGATRFGGDLARPGLLHARVVPSLYAHARLRAIDATAALAVPGVVAVLTARDLAIVGRGDERRYEPLARDEVTFAGQPVALVIARSEASAEDAVELVEVDVEPLEPVVDAIAAMDPGAPLARIGAVAEPVEGGNVVGRQHDRRGSIEDAFAACDVTVGGRFRAPWAYQAYLEPQVATAAIEPDGTLVVVSSTQGTFVVRDELATIYGLATSRVRVAAAPLGGAFGGKQGILEPLVAGAALHLRAPVRLTLTRREDFAATNPAQGMVIDLRIGARRSGRFEALEARVCYDAGAYAESSWEWYAPRLLAGPYRWAAFDIEGVSVRTNRFGVGNYRAPSGPQGVFALESLVDELAVRLGLDPFELRALNLAGEGDLMADGAPWPRIGARECLDRLHEHPLWTGRGRLPPGEGVGVAIGVWLGSKQPAAATCRLEPDGTLSVITGAVDMSGTAGGLAIIAAEAFGVPVDAVSIVSADTASAPLAPASNASAITYACGPAVRAAALEARGRLLAAAAERFEIRPDDLEILDGIVRPRDSPGLGRPVAELARELAEAFDSPHPPVEGHGATAHASLAPSAVGHLAHVRVDAETGCVELLGYAVVQDVGRALNPALVEDQMLGGAVQSIGRALYEELIHDDQAQLLTGTFLDYAVPRACTLPPIDTLLVEVPAPEGPHGARGIGEASILPGPAAIANAIAAASRIRLHELPMTPRRIWAAAMSNEG
jgi:CO/xanthine dehydrogenase Mo-binding subunit